MAGSQRQATPDRVEAAVTTGLQLSAVQSSYEKERASHQAVVRGFEDTLERLRRELREAESKHKAALDEMVRCETNYRVKIKELLQALTSTLASPESHPAQAQQQHSPSLTVSDPKETDLVTSSQEEETPRNDEVQPSDPQPDIVLRRTSRGTRRRQQWPPDPAFAEPEHIGSDIMRGEERSGSRKRRHGADDKEAQASGSTAAKKQKTTDEADDSIAARNPKFIEFDEIYQGGKAEYKHMIFEYPQDSGNWYIIRCDAHGLHFGKNPLRGDVSHISSSAHGRLPRFYDLAVQRLGIRVLNCTFPKAVQNNDDFLRALAKGYKPLKPNLPVEKLEVSSPGAVGTEAPNPPSQPSMSRSGERDLVPQAEDAAPTKNQRKEKTFDGITDPTIGEVYLGYWNSQSSQTPSGWYAALVVPLGSFEAIGMLGGIADTELINGHIPLCYNSNKKNILGWAMDYEASGPYVHKRKFPVMWFDDDQITFPEDGSDFTIPNDATFAWLSASRLRPFSRYGPDGSPALGYDAARQFAQRLKSSRPRIAEPQHRDIRPSAAVDRTVRTLPNSTSNSLMIHIQYKQTMQQRFSVNDPSPPPPAADNCQTNAAPQAVQTGHDELVTDISGVASVGEHSSKTSCELGDDFGKFESNPDEAEVENNVQPVRKPSPVNSHDDETVRGQMMESNVTIFHESGQGGEQVESLALSSEFEADFHAERSSSSPTDTPQPDCSVAPSPISAMATPHISVPSVSATSEQLSSPQKTRTISSRLTGTSRGSLASIATHLMEEASTAVPDAPSGLGQKEPSAQDEPWVNGEPLSATAVLESETLALHTPRIPSNSSGTVAQQSDPRPVAAATGRPASSTPQFGQPLPSKSLVSLSGSSLPRLPPAIKASSRASAEKTAAEHIEAAQAAIQALNHSRMTAPKSSFSSDKLRPSPTTNSHTSRPHPASFITSSPAEGSPPPRSNASGAPSQKPPPAVGGWQTTSSRWLDLPPVPQASLFHGQYTPPGFRPINQSYHAHPVRQESSRSVPREHHVGEEQSCQGGSDKLK